MNPSSDFRSFLAGFNRDTLKDHDGPIVGLRPDLRMAYFNPSWFAFARENDGEPAITRDWPLGRSIMDAVPDELKSFYRGHFEACLASGVPWSHSYECSSAATFRRFHLRAYPLARGGGLLVVHSRQEAYPITREDHLPLNFSPSDHVDENGFVHQCANCRRIENLCTPCNRWDWVPTLVDARYDRVSHTICPICLAYYHP